MPTIYDTIKYAAVGFLVGAAVMTAFLLLSGCSTVPPPSGERFRPFARPARDHERKLNHMLCYDKNGIVRLRDGTDCAKGEK